jgi:hypothetical protein
MVVDPGRWAMNHRYSHLTGSEYCLAALDHALDERNLDAVEAGAFAAGFVAGWRELGRDQRNRGMTTVSRDYLAALEVAAEQKEAGQ